MERREAAKLALAPLIMFGLTSLLADVCYEGFRGILGPVSFEKGGDWLQLGLVLVEAELINWGFRLPAGILADVLRAWWPLTFLGYALTPLGVLIATLGSGMTAVAVGVGLERLGKTLRGPARDALLSGLGRKKGLVYAIHELMDQVGAVAGPILAYILLASGAPWLIAVPGALALLTLLGARLTYPPGSYTRRTRRYAISLNPRWFALGLVATLTPHPVIVSAMLGEKAPLAYTLAMLVDAVAALPLGKLYDIVGKPALVTAPIASVVAALLMALNNPWAAAAMVGLAFGAYETVYRAHIASTSREEERATAFGAYSLGFGVGQAIAAIAYAMLASLVIG